MTGLSYDEISRPDQVNTEFKTDIALMFWGIAVGFTAFGNAEVNSPAKKLDAYESALVAVKKALSIAQQRSAPGDQLYNDLLYLKAADYAHIWLVGDGKGLRKDQFDRAVREFDIFLTLPERFHSGRNIIWRACTAKPPKDFPVRHHHRRCYAYTANTE